MTELSELTTHPTVVAAIEARDAAHAAFTAPGGPDAAWQTAARSLAIASTYGSHNGRNAHEIAPEERELRAYRDAAWKTVVDRNTDLVRAQHRVLTENIAAERRAEAERRAAESSGGSIRAVPGYAPSARGNRGR